VNATGWAGQHREAAASIPPMTVAPAAGAWDAQGRLRGGARGPAVAVRRECVAITLEQKLEFIPPPDPRFRSWWAPGRDGIRLVAGRLRRGQQLLARVDQLVIATIAVGRSGGIH
jgi:hypothetical protein